MGSTDLHEDYIFLTENHDHASTAAIWLTKKYNPESHFVQFYKVEPEDKVGIISVKCRKVNAHETQVEVSYEYIGLSKKGNKFIEQFTRSGYEQFIGEWKRLLTNYFEGTVGFKH